jgi:CheY-like chemotaxis protein
MAMGKRVLLIDDDADLVATIKTVLEAKGYEVATADSGESALKVLEAGPQPDAMVLDVMMAGRGDGLIFARRVRKLDAFKAIPIVMLTGMRAATGFGPIQDDPRDPIFLPVDVFLEKPVKPDVLLGKLEAVLAGKKR